LGSQGLLLLSLVVSFLLTTTGCDEVIFERSIVVSGVVVELESQAPIDSAWIVMGDTTIVRKENTDSLGQFALPSPPFASSYKVLYAGKNGYRTGLDTVWHATEDVTDVVIELEQGGE
jgi:hypothetical protein